MKLQQARKLLEDLKGETEKKSELKIYDQFVEVLVALNLRKFSNEEVKGIEAKLDKLEQVSQSKRKKRMVAGVLEKFETYLKDTFSLTTKKHYTKLGMGLGCAFGLLFGTVVLGSFERSMGISVGAALGLAIGLTIGRSMDKKAEEEGKVL